MQRLILSLIAAVLPTVASAGGVCSSSLFVQAASVPVDQGGIELEKLSTRSS